jgi:hypothetical protein
MLGKRFALGFGIAVILPFMLHLGVNTFSPPPNWEDYNIVDYYDKLEEASEEERAELEAKWNDLKVAQDRHEARYQKALFLVMAPAGIAAIVIGAFIGFQAIGAGLMFGGIFCLMDGYIQYWEKLPDWMRFVSLLVAFIALLIVGYFRIIKHERKE